MGIQGVTAPAREPTGTSPRRVGPEAGEILERRELPAGRSLVVLASAEGSSTLEIRSPQGEVEVTIVCGPAGPVVSVRAARLELEAPSVGIRCEDFDLSATRSLALRSADLGIQSEGELRLNAVNDVHINGDFLRLNCTDESDPPVGT